MKMNKPKIKFIVYYQHYFATDYPEVYGTKSDSGYDADEWMVAGETYAVSEAKAINNVRCRLFGPNSSQYYPSGSGNSWAEGYNWKAVHA